MRRHLCLILSKKWFFKLIIFFMKDLALYIYELKSNKALAKNGSIRYNCSR